VLVRVDAAVVGGFRALASDVIGIRGRADEKRGSDQAERSYFKLHWVDPPKMPAHCTSHFKPHPFVQSAPTAHVPLQIGLLLHVEVHSEPDSQLKLQLALSLQVISHVVPVGQVNLQLLRSWHVSLHVRWNWHEKSHCSFPLHVQLSPQSPFVALLPEELVPLSTLTTPPDDDEEDEVDEPLDVCAAVPPSPPPLLPVFQSSEHPTTAETPKATVSGMTRRGLTAP
jgi:hypothetical protein